MNFSYIFCGTLINISIVPGKAAHLRISVEWTNYENATDTLLRNEMGTSNTIGTTTAAATAATAATAAAAAAAAATADGCKRGLGRWVQR